MSDLEVSHLNLLDLPNEILMKILENLPLTYIKPVRQTCSRLYKLGYSQKIMKKQIFVIRDSQKKQNNEVMLNRIIKMELTGLNLKFDISDKHLITEFLSSIGTKICSLYFCFHRTSNLSFSVIKLIFLSCVNLKELRFCWVNFIEWPADLDSNMKWKETSVTNPTLEVLEFERCSNFTDRLVNKFLNVYPLIRELYICLDMNYDEAVTKQYYENFEEPSPEILTADFLIHKVINCNIYIQKLCWLIPFRVGDGLTKTQFMSLVSSNLRLRSMHLRGQNTISETEFKILFSRHNLRELKIDSCKHFDIESLQHLFKFCPELQSLILEGVSSASQLPYYDALRMLSEMGRNVKVFEYICYDGFGDQINPSLHLRFPNLEHVCLSKMRNIFNCYFLENCRLTCLDLTGGVYFYLNDMLLRIISTQQKTLKILRLNFSKQNAFNSDQETAWDIYFPKLEELKISSLPLSLTRQILGKFNLPCLKKLDIPDCDALNKEDLELMKLGCPLLESLRCPFIESLNREMEEIRKCWYFLEDLHNYRNECQVRSFFPSENNDEYVYFMVPHFMEENISDSDDFE